MANDRHVIQYLSPADLVGLMNSTGFVTVHDTITADGKPVIHAVLTVVNAETGEQIPGGLPFSVVMFKNQNEPGYSNIAIGTIVPATELRVALPRDYFNFCNQRFRFSRVFPIDEGSFVIQMDLVLRNATREYVKFSFGLWRALFSQMLFELIGRGRQSLISAAEAYAEAHTDFAQQIATTPEVAVVEPVAVEMPVMPPADSVAEISAEPEAVLPLETEAIVPDETLVEPAQTPCEEASAIEAAGEMAIAEDRSGEIVPEEVLAEPAASFEQPVEAVEPVEDTTEPELSIAAGLTADASPEEAVADVLPMELEQELPPEGVEETPLEKTEAKDAVPA